MKDRKLPEGFPEDKKCTKCGNWYYRTNEYFDLNKQTKDGLHSNCKHCRADEQRVRNNIPRDPSAVLDVDFRCQVCGHNVAYGEVAQDRMLRPAVVFKERKILCKTCRELRSEHGSIKET